MSEKIHFHHLVREDSLQFGNFLAEKEFAGTGPDLDCSDRIGHASYTATGGVCRVPAATRGHCCTHSFVGRLFAEILDCTAVLFSVPLCNSFRAKCAL